MTAPAPVTPVVGERRGFDPVRALLARGTLYTLATALQVSTAVLVLPAVTRLLPATEYGVVAVAVVVQLVLGLAGSAGLPETLPSTYFRTADGPDRARTLVAVAFATSFLVVLLAEATGALWSASLLDLPYETPVRIAVWSAVPFAVLITAQAVLRAGDRAGAFFATAVIGTAGAQALGLVFLVAFGASPAAFLAGMTLGISLGAVAAVATSGLSLRGFASPRFLRSSLAFSLPAVAHGLALYLVWAGARAVLNHLEGPAAVGRFHVAYLVGGLAVVIVSAIYRAWSPIVFGAPDERRWAALADTTEVVYRVAAAVAVAIAIAAPIALVVLAPNYDPLGLVTVSSVVTLSAVPFVTYCASLNVILWHGRTLTLAWTTPLVAAANVGLNLGLIPLLGFSGAAVATVLAYTLQALLVTWAARRLVRVPWRLRPAIEAAAATGAAVALSALLPAGGEWLAIRFLLALAPLAWLASLVVRLRRPAARWAA
ncbi:MAG: polysaccharide biosynthesis C-terminal domain-containing protein [Thermoleophilia bacterium]|nr:polysaccharide biosynthesis C-terminal domain-containing protein [Thermoleophilia bacterium]